MPRMPITRQVHFERHLVGIPAQLLDVLQELVGAHVGGVQAGLVLPGHLRGPSRGLPTHLLICNK